MQIIIGIFILFVLIYILTKNKSQNQNRISQNKVDKEQDLFTVSPKNLDTNSVEFTVSLNEKELIKRAKNGTLNTEIKNRAKSIEDIAGFYGSTQYSPNKEYGVCYVSGYLNDDKWQNGNIALIKGDTLLFKKILQRPNDCYVSNDGIIICCDWLNSEEPAGKFLIFSREGDQLFVKKTSANLGACGISDNSEIAIFETYNSDTHDGDKIFVVNVNEKNIISKFDRPHGFINVSINTETEIIDLIDNKRFIFQVNFQGEQTNKEDYEDQILSKGSVIDKICLFENKPIGIYA